VATERYRLLVSGRCKYDDRPTVDSCVDRSSGVSTLSLASTVDGVTAWYGWLDQGCDHLVHGSESVTRGGRNGD